MKITSLDDINSGVKNWMQEQGVHKIIAFSGSSSTETPTGVDKELAKTLSESTERYINSILEGTLMHLSEYQVAILTGGTKGEYKVPDAPPTGVPELATRAAKKFGLLTIGVYPEGRAEKDSLFKEGLLDCAIEVGSVFGESTFGDESTVFAKLADASVIFGGGAGTLVEVSHALKLNDDLFKRDEHGKVVPKTQHTHPKYVIPVEGIPGVGSIIKLLPGKSIVREGTFPEKNIRSPFEIFTYLSKQLKLGDIHRDDNKK